MLLKFRKNLLLINTLFFLAYSAVVQADECGVLRYMANKSTGVTVKNNTCKTTDAIAVGSEFNLTPGARLWFKSQDAADAQKMQGICQNRSSKPVRINVDTNKLPWINPTGLSNCSPWTHNKINCDDSTGAQKTLTCVIAAINSEAPTNEIEERTTSVRMRSLPTPDDADDAATEQEHIVSAMQADVDLCKALDRANSTINITWLVESNGRVKTVTADPSGPAEQPLVNCLTAVINDFPYPKSAQAIRLSHQF